MPIRQEKNVRLVPHDLGEPPGEIEIEARLHREGYAAFRWYDVPGSNYPKHKHAVDECIWVASGTIEFVVMEPGKSEVTYRLKPGDRIYLPSGIAHTAKASDQGVTYWVGQREKLSEP